MQPVLRVHLLLPAQLVLLLLVLIVLLLEVLEVMVVIVGLEVDAEEQHQVEI